MSAPAPVPIPSSPASGDDAYMVTLETSGWTYAARGDETLLQAGLRAGVRLASSCRNGTCRACMCHLASGDIAYAVERPGLSRDEIDEGWVLPCVALPRSDVTLAGDNAERMAREAPRPLPVGPRR